MVLSVEYVTKKFKKIDNVCVGGGWERGREERRRGKKERNVIVFLELHVL